jgi:hypothetical protein
MPKERVNEIGFERGSRDARDKPLLDGRRDAANEIKVALRNCNALLLKEGYRDSLKIS